MKKIMIAAAAAALTTPAFAQTATTEPTDPAAIPTEETTTAPGIEPTGVIDTETTTTTDPATPAVDPAVSTGPATTTTADGIVTHSIDATSGPATVTLDQPGVTASWLNSRSIWTTNQPSTTEWVDVTVTERPSDWEQIADVSDLVLTDDGRLVGYTADIGGFLGLGGRTVLLNNDALHIVRFGDDAYLVTNYSREELESLPEFDTNMVNQ